jgi:hypothetical protein
LVNGLSPAAQHSVDGAIHFVCMDWRHSGELQAAGGNIYSELKNVCVWVKTNAGMGSFYRSQHELIFVFKCGDGPHLNNFELGQNGRNRTNVWKYAGVAPHTQPQAEAGRASRSRMAWPNPHRDRD